MHARTHARTNSRTHAHTHARTHALTTRSVFYQSLVLQGVADVSQSNTNRKALLTTAGNDNVTVMRENSFRLKRERTSV